MGVGELPVPGVCIWVLRWLSGFLLLSSEPHCMPTHGCPASICCWLYAWWTHCLLYLSLVRPIVLFTASYAPELSLSLLYHDCPKPGFVFHLDSSMIPPTSQSWLLVGSPVSTIRGCPCPSTEHMGPSSLPYWTKDKKATGLLDSVFLSAYQGFPQLILCWVVLIWELGSTRQDGSK